MKPVYWQVVYEVEDIGFHRYYLLSDAGETIRVPKPKFSAEEKNEIAAFSKKFGVKPGVLMRPVVEMRWRRAATELRIKKNKEARK